MAEMTTRRAILRGWRGVYSCDVGPIAVSDNRTGPWRSLYQTWGMTFVGGRRRWDAILQPGRGCRRIVRTFTTLREATAFAAERWQTRPDGAAGYLAEYARRDPDARVLFEEVIAGEIALADRLFDQLDKLGHAPSPLGWAALWAARWPRWARATPFVEALLDQLAHLGITPARAAR
jgi:hypothetical protein